MAQGGGIDMGRSQSEVAELAAGGAVLLSEADLRQIHQATLRILERTGIGVEADDALAVFADGGCVVDRETRSVRIPPEVVERALELAPRTFTLCARDPALDLTTGAGRTVYSNFGEACVMVDLETGLPAGTRLWLDREKTRLDAMYLYTQVHPGLPLHPEHFTIEGPVPPQALHDHPAIARLSADLRRGAV